MMIFRINHSSSVVTILRLSGITTMVLLYFAISLLAQERHKGTVNNANTPLGSISGKCASYDGSPFKDNPFEKPKEVQLYDALIQKLQTVIVKNDGTFLFKNLGSGEYIINIVSTGNYDHPAVVLLGENESKDIGEQRLAPYPIYPSFFVDINAILPKLYPIDIDGQYPVISGHKVLTVCEYLKIRSNYPLFYSYFQRVIIIGNLMQTSRGSWLQQSCENPVKSGAHAWPDTIFLGNKVDNIRETMGESDYPIILDSNSNLLKETDKRFGKSFIQNNSNSNNVAVAVIGQLTTRDNLVYVNCGEGKTCGFGHGPIAAPAQIEYWQMRHLNQDDNTRK